MNALVLLAVSAAQHTQAEVLPGHEECKVASAFKKVFDISPSLIHEVILVPTIETEQDVKRVVKALHADYAQTGDRWRIYRSDENEAGLRKKDAGRLARQIRSAATIVDNLTKNSKTAEEGVLNALTSARAAYKEHPGNFDPSTLYANQATPAARLLATLLRNFDSKNLGKVVPGSLVIFSNSPVGAEIALPDGNNALSTYENAESNFREWAGKADAEGRITDSDRWIFPRQTYLPGPRTVQLWIDRRDAEPSFAVEVYDASGKLESNALLTASGFGRQPGPDAKRIPVLGKVSVPGASLAEAFDNLHPTDPAKRDPLDLYVRGLLLLWGKARGYAKVFACVPDALLTEAKNCVNGSEVDLDILSTAIENSGCESLADGNTLIIRPRYPLEEEIQRIDRTPLSDLFKVGSSGLAGLEDLLAYHAAFADSYDHRPVLRLMEKPITQGFGLTSAEWTLPHSYLAIAGMLSAAQRQDLDSRGTTMISERRFAGCLFSLSQSSVPVHKDSNDLSRSPSRICANSDACWLDGALGTPYTLIRRVSKGYAERIYGDLVTGERSVEKGNNIVLDKAFIRPQLALTELYGSSTVPEGANVHRDLSEHFNFYWKRERLISLRVRFGSIAQSGPIALREVLSRSKGAVDLDQVPGFPMPNVSENFLGSHSH